MFTLRKHFNEAELMEETEPDPTTTHHNINTVAPTRRGPSHLELHLSPPGGSSG